MTSPAPRPSVANLLLLLVCVVSSWGLSRSTSETDIELPDNFGEDFVKEEGDSRRSGGLELRSSPPGDPRRTHFGELDGSSELVTWVADGTVPPTTKEPKRSSGGSRSGSRRTRLKVRRKHRHRHRDGHRRRNRNKAAYVHRKAMQTDLLEEGIAAVFRGVAYGRSASVPPTTVDLEATHLLGSHRPTTRSSRNSSDDDAPKVNEEEEEEATAPEDPPPDEAVDEVKIRSADVDYRNDREADVPPVALENMSEDAGGNDTATDVVDLQTSNSTEAPTPKTKVIDEVTTTVASEAPPEVGETSTARSVEEPAEVDNTTPVVTPNTTTTTVGAITPTPTPTPTPSDNDDTKLENLTRNTTSVNTSSGKNCSDWNTREGAGMSFVYIFEAIFFLLALLSLWRLVTLQACTFLLPRTYFVCIHLLLFTTTAFRAVYVFHLAYRGRDSLPPALLLLLLDTSLPCLLSALCVLLLAIIKVLRDKIAPALNPVPHRVGVFLASLIAWSVTCDMIVGSVHDVMALLILTRVIILTFAVTAGLAFLVKYSCVRSELSRMMTENRRDMKLLMAPLVDARARRRTAKPQQIASLATMCRCMVVIVILMFLLCALNIYILAVITTPSLVHLKSWWALSGCTWVVEACLVGLLIVAAALTQGTYSRDKLIYVLLVPSICTRPENGKPARTNNNNNCAYQRVSYSSYTDSSQKTPVLEVSDPESSSRDREQYSTVVAPGPATVRRSATFHCAPSRPIPPRIHGAYLTRPQPPSRIASSLTRIPSCPARTSSSSMLVNDGGFVRFRTQVDVEHPLGERPRRHPSHPSIASYKELSRPEAHYVPSQEPAGPVLPPLSRGSSPYGSRASLSQQSTHSLYGPRQQVESPMHGDTPYAEARTLRMGYPEGNCNSVYGAYPAMVHRSPSHRYTNLRRNNSFANHHQTTTSSQGSYEHYNSLPGRRRYSKRHRLHSTHGHPQQYYEPANHGAGPPPPAYGTANDRYTTRDIRMLTSAGNYAAYPPYPGTAQRPYPPQQQYLQNQEAYRGYIHEYPPQGGPDHHHLVHPDLVGSSYGRGAHGDRQQPGDTGRERRGDKDTEWAIELIKSSPILAEFYAIKEEREKEEKEKEERELEERRKQERRKRETRDNPRDESEKT
ncbi:uncharacterized protein LOC143033249 [Oratosquilla oratoria]|uniref:uncharacterized protein LOC143033249 n=1 Tax=Oratosquilla oratoria TaxID=337810 RepID=UPI003F762602